VFNLLVRAGGWAESHDTMLASRALSYTDQHVADKYQTNDKLDFPALFSLPTLFVEEGYGDETARIGTITRARSSGRHIYLDYYYDSSVPSISNKNIKTLASELDIDDFEFSTTHWAVKERDIFKVLLINAHQRPSRPRVFQISNPENIESNLGTYILDGTKACRHIARDRPALRQKHLRSTILTTFSVRSVSCWSAGRIG